MREHRNDKCVLETIKRRKPTTARDKGTMSRSTQLGRVWWDLLALGDWPYFLPSLSTWGWLGTHTWSCAQRKTLCGLTSISLDARQTPARWHRHLLPVNYFLHPHQVCKKRCKDTSLTSLIQHLPDDSSNGQENKSPPMLNSSAMPILTSRHLGAVFIHVC